MDEFEASRLTIPEISNAVEKRIITEADQVYAVNNMMNLLHEVSTSPCENDFEYSKALQKEEISLCIEEKRINEIIDKLDQEGLKRWRIGSTVFLLCTIIIFCLYGHPLIPIFCFICIVIVDI